MVEDGPALCGCRLPTAVGRGGGGAGSHVIFATAVRTQKYSETTNTKQRAKRKAIIALCSGGLGLVLMIIDTRGISYGQPETRSTKHNLTRA